MKVIHQLIQYLEDQGLITPEVMDRLRVLGLVSRRQEDNDDHPYSHLEDIGCEQEFDDPPDEEDPHEVLENQLLADARKSQAGRATSSKGTRRKRRSREHDQVLSRLRRELDELMHARPLVENALLSLGRRIDPSADSWTASVRALRDSSDEQFVSSLTESLRADELPLSALRILLTFDDHRSLLSRLPAPLRHVSRPLFEGGRTVPPLPKHWAERSPLDELNALWIVRQRLIARLRDLLQDNPQQVFHSKPNGFGEWYQLGLLLVAIAQSGRAAADSSAAFGTKPVVAEEADPAETRLVLCRRSKLLESNADWQRFSERAWQLAVLLFPESSAELLAAWGHAEELSVCLSEVPLPLQSRARELADFVELAQGDAGKVTALNWTEHLNSLLSDPNRTLQQFGKNARDAMWCCALLRYGDATSIEQAEVWAQSDIHELSRSAYLIHKLWAENKIGDDSAVLALLGCMAHSEATWQFRQTAHSVLAEIGSPAVPVIIRCLSNARWRIQRHAADALGNMGAPLAASAVPTLIAALKESDFTVRCSAIEALGKLGAPSANSAVPALIDRLKDPSEWVRRRAADALGQFFSQAIAALPALRDRLTDSDPSVQAAARTAIQRIKSA
ncbi:MAG: HEAT repeat domain-containing protein [Planctomycetaceae bacterium]